MTKSSPPIAMPLAMLLLLTACAGSGPPETVRYLLRAKSTPAQRLAVDAPRVGIGQVIVAPYLDQLGIVLETAPGEVRAARHHLWAEPFDQGLRHYLRQALSDELNLDVSIDPTQQTTWDYRLDVRVDELHGGTETGDVRIVVEYTWTPAAPDSAIERSIFADVEPLSSNGYGAMVAAHKALLTRLADVMANLITERVRG